MRKDYERARPEIDFGAPKRKVLTQPNMALSISEIMNKSLRGVAVDVKHRTPVWMDQEQHDIEKLSRMEFGEKAQMSEELMGRHNAILDEYEANEAKRKQAEEEEKVAEDVPEKAPKEPKKASEKDAKA